MDNREPPTPNRQPRWHRGLTQRLCDSSALVAACASLTAVTVVPLIFSNRLASEGYITLKNMTVGLLGACAVFAIALAFVADAAWLPRRLLAPVALLLASQLLSIPGTVNPGLSFNELLRVAALAALFLATAGALRQQFAAATAWAVLGVASCISLLGVIDFWTGAIFPAIHDSYGFKMCGATLGHDNFAGEYLIAALPLGLALVAKAVEEYRLARGLAALLGSCTILVFISITFSRGAWLGLAASLIMFVALLHRRYVGNRPEASDTLLARRKRIMGCIFSAAFVCVGALSFSLHHREKGLSAIQKARTTVDLSDAPIAFRLKLWQGSLRLAKQHPVFGVGCGAFALYYPLVRLPEEHRIAGMGISVRSPHNDYIKLACESGALGLIASFLLLAAAARPLLRCTVQSSQFKVTPNGEFAVRRTNGQRQESLGKTLPSANSSQIPPYAIGASSAIVATLVHALFSGNFTTPASAVMLAVNMGLMVGTVDRPSFGPVRISPGSRLLIAVGLAVLGVFLIVRPMQFLIADYNFLKGRLSSQAGNIQQAKEVLRRSIASANYYLEPRILLANLHLQDQEPQQAIDVLKPALSLSPFWPQIQNNIGVAYSQRAAEKGDPGSLLSAYQAFDRAVRLDPEFTEAWLNLGSMLQSIGQHSEAEKAFAKALSLSPGNPIASSKLAETLVAQKRPVEARKTLEQALQTSPDDPNLLNNLGMVLLSQDKEDQAFGCFEKAAALESDLFQPHLNLAQLLEKQGEIDKAMYHYRIALQKKPDLEAAQEALKRLSKQE